METQTLESRSRIQKRDVGELTAVSLNLIKEIQLIGTVRWRLYVHATPYTKCPYG